MNLEEYTTQKQLFVQEKAAFDDNEKLILAGVERLHALIEKRQQSLQGILPACAQLRRAAVELRTGDAFRVDLLIKGDTYGEVVKAWMDRFDERKKGGHDLSYERLLSNRPEPREKPGVRYDSTGHEVQVTGPRKLRVAPGNMAETMKKIAEW